MGCINILTHMYHANKYISESISKKKYFPAVFVLSRAFTACQMSELCVCFYIMTIGEHNPDNLKFEGKMNWNCKKANLLLLLQNFVEWQLFFLLLRSEADWCTCVTCFLVQRIKFYFRCFHDLPPVGFRVYPA